MEEFWQFLMRLKAIGHHRDIALASIGFATVSAVAFSGYDPWPVALSVVGVYACYAYLQGKRLEHGQRNKELSIREKELRLERDSQTKRVARKKVEESS